MKIKINTYDVLPPLKAVASVVNPKNALPILANVLLEIEADERGNARIKMTGSDGETHVSMSAPVLEWDREDTTEHSVCIDAKRIVTILGNFGERVVEITFKKFTAHIDYDNGHFELPYSDALAYPIAKDDETSGDRIEASINARRLALALARTECGVANDQLRPVICGIHFDFFKTNMVAVSSDSKILVKHVDNEIKMGEGQECGFTFPQKPAHLLLSMLQKIDDDVVMSFSDKNLKVMCPQFNLATRLIEGRFPNYDAVIPKDGNKFATINREELLSSLRRIMPFGNDNTNMVKFAFSEGQVFLLSQDIDLSTSATERIACDYNGDPITIGFNGSKVALLVSNIECEKIKIAMSNPSRAAIITPDMETDGTNIVSLVMPMMIQ